ncbi:hypothetical protein EDB85DRAFT_1990180 [Lactarius pseudohatsudake]|nr:hypothetical protein EDB85DRAFT_1990180 [Lactarius pseudohatsudake]
MTRSHCAVSDSRRRLCKRRSLAPTGLPSDSDPPCWEADGARITKSAHERRTTFGLPQIHPRDPTTSEQGSLHSMQSHLSPHSALSASGSISASGHSRAFTLASLKSLAHSSSVTSADRRIARPSPGEVSPAQHQHQQRPHRVVAPPPAQSATVTSTTMTTTTTRSSVTTHTSVTDSDPVTGEVSRVAHAAWTGGRERESAVPEADLGGARRAGAARATCGYCRTASRGATVRAMRDPPSSFGTVILGWRFLD